MPEEIPPKSTVALIPAEEVARLLALHAARDLLGLRARIKALRLAGWTLAGIGGPMGMPFSTIRAWENAADRGQWPIPHDVPTPARPPRQAGHVIRVRKIRPDVPPSERPLLRQLADNASILRRTTPRNHPAWQSQTELELLLARYINRGVPTASLARHCGVTHRAIAARMERAAVRMIARQRDDVA